MNRQIASCDRNRLRLLLDDQLTLTETRSTEQHLDRCPTCRRDLEWLAADPHWWRDASQFLRIAPEETSDTEAYITDGPPRSSAPVGVSTDGEPSTFDLVLQYLEPSDDPSMLGRLGNYEIVRVVGQGGMGIVLKGYDGELNRYVAVKVLAPHFAGSAAARQRFAREAQAAAAIVHPHVIPIHAVDVTGPLPYLVMPFMAGQSLHERLLTEGPLPLREILRIGLQAAEGLAAAHAQGLVHRDVKPANILLEKGVNRVLLTDFGLARAVDDATLTRSGVIAGTPQFMSPEQARGDAVDCRSDLFSLGSVLYSMCTGYPPFRAETWIGVLRRITDGSARPVREINPDIPEWLDRLIQQLHAKSPAARPPTAADVARTLEQCLAHVQQPVTSPLPASLLLAKPAGNQPKLKHLMLAAAAALACVGLLAAMAWQYSGRDRPDNTAPSPPSVVPLSDTAESETTTGAGTADARPYAADLEWNDSTNQEIVEMAHMLRMLERQVERDPLTVDEYDANGQQR